MSLPWFPFYRAAFRNDTGHLTNAEKGAYLELILHYYEHGGLPADEKLIRRIACMSTAEWDESRDVLAALFRDGWKHKRIDDELAKAASVSQKRSKAARAKAAKAGQVQSNCSANADHLHTHETENIEHSCHENEVSVRFPRDGSLRYASGPWADIAKAAGRNIDLDVLAQAFRSWCIERNIELDAPGIEKTFATFCRKHKPSLYAVG